MDTYIFINNLNSIYLLLNHIKSLSSQYNHPNKLLIAYIINTIQKVCSQTNISGNEEFDKLAKQGAKAPHIIATLLYLIGHQTPYWPQSSHHLFNMMDQSATKKDTLKKHMKMH